MKWIRRIVTWALALTAVGLCGAVFSVRGCSAFPNQRFHACWLCGKPGSHNAVVYVSKGRPETYYYCDAHLSSKKEEIAVLKTGIGGLVLVLSPLLVGGLLIAAHIVRDDPRWRVSPGVLAFPLIPCLAFIYWYPVYWDLSNLLTLVAIFWLLTGMGLAYIETGIRTGSWRLS